jgi:hypothetical protein
MSNEQLKVYLLKKNNLITGFRIKGHANYNDYGKDIVCAAISVLAQTTIQSILDHTAIDQQDIDFDLKNGSGYVKINNEFIDDNINLLLKAFETGVKGVEETYGDYVIVIEEEVD